MTYPRSHLVSDEEPGFYHVVSRCVRRAFLCGNDRFTGRCFEHRRGWIEDRILDLAESFAVSVYSYAVMSNHFHVVLHVDPSAVASWSDDEVASRWLAAFPGPLKRNQSEEHAQRVNMAIVSDPQRVQELRRRLGSLSWFMKALNEPIARMANREDQCTGKFWEGRFKCQVLLEAQAVLSAMAYVDLNPARANLAETLEESDHTSIKIRKESDASLTNRSTYNARPLKPVAGLGADELLEMTESSYIELVQWAGEQPHPFKRGTLKPQSESHGKPPSGIWSITNHPDCWLRQVQGTESRYFRAIGSAEALMAKAAELGQRWLRGVSGERAIMILRAQTE